MLQEAGAVSTVKYTGYAAGCMHGEYQALLKL
jgi:hypothetical protein